MRVYVGTCGCVWVSDDDEDVARDYTIVALDQVAKIGGVCMWGWGVVGGWRCVCDEEEDFLRDKAIVASGRVASV